MYRVFFLIFISFLVFESCDFNRTHTVNDYFYNLRKNQRVDSINYSSGELAMVVNLNAKNKLEGYARVFYGNGYKWQGYYFKDGFPCYDPDLLADLKELKYSADFDSVGHLQVGDTFELRFWHDELMPFFVDFEVSNAIHEIQYGNAWSLFLIPTGGDCHVKATVWFRSLPPVLFFDEVFKTKACEVI